MAGIWSLNSSLVVAAMNSPVSHCIMNYCPSRVCSEKINLRAIGDFFSSRKTAKYRLKKEERKKKFISVKHLNRNSLSIVTEQ